MGRARGFDSDVLWIHFCSTVIYKITYISLFRFGWTAIIWVMFLLHGRRSK